MNLAKTHSAIEVHSLTKTYRGFPALKDLSLSLPAGQIVGLFGDNGSGKTTLLKILAGVLADWNGNVLVCGHHPGPQSKARVSFLPDTSFLADSLTPAQSVAQFARFFADFDRAQASEMIRYFQLPEDRSLKQMSKGMREKLQIALAMSREADVFLLDEPISGVDPAARTIILQGILRNFRPRATMVISTHLIQDIERIVDSAIFLRSGQILLAGNADDLRAQYGSNLDSIFRKVYTS